MYKHFFSFSSREVNSNILEKYYADIKTELKFEQILMWYNTSKGGKLMLWAFLDVDKNLKNVPGERNIIVVLKSKL